MFSTNIEIMHYLECITEETYQNENWQTNLEVHMKNSKFYITACIQTFKSFYFMKKKHFEII